MAGVTDADLQNRFNYIADAYIEPQFSSSVILKPTVNAIANVRGLDSSKIEIFIKGLFQSYDAFASLFFDSRDFNTDTSTYSVSANKYGQSTYADIANTNLILNSSPVSNITQITGYNNLTEAEQPVEVNLKNFLRRNKNITNHIATIRKLYWLLDDNNWNAYKTLTNSDAANQVIHLHDYSTLSNYNTSNYQDQSSVITLFTNIGSGYSYITYLLGGNNTLNATSITLDEATFNTSNVPNDVMYETRIMKLIPKTARSGLPQVYSSNLTTLRSNIITPGNTKYYTISFYARASAAGGEKTNVSFTVNTILQDLPNNSTIVSLQQKNYRLSPTWKNIEITREVSLPQLAPSSTNVKLNMELRINHDTQDMDKNAVLITGLRVIERNNLQEDISPKLPQLTEATNRFVVRRLLLLYELIAVYYMSVRIVQANWSGNISSASALTTTQKYARAIHFLVVEYLYNYNYNLSREDIPGFDGKSILKYYNSNIAKDAVSYTTTTTNLGVNTADVNTLKNDLLGNITSLDNKKSDSKRTGLYMIIVIILSAIIVLVAIIILVIPVDSGTKVAAGMGVALFGVVFMIMFKLFAGTKIEKFSLPSTYQTTILGSSTTGTQFISSATTFAKNYAYDYLQNTITLALLLQTSSTYRAVNNSLTKENNFYANTKEQLSASVKKVQDAANATSLDDYTKRARISFVINFTIVVATMVGGSVISSSVPFLRNLFLIAGCIGIVVVTSLYVLDVSRRVRSSGDKIYWLRPTVDGL